MFDGGDVTDEAAVHSELLNYTGQAMMATRQVVEDPSRSRSFHELPDFA
jgi:hypothetical protein